MPKVAQDEITPYTFTVNRELSWLQFNLRVLSLAEDPQIPLAERWRYLGIFSDNLDDFFRVRVGKLKRMACLTPWIRDNKSGMTADEQCAAIYAHVRKALLRRDKALDSCMCELTRQGLERFSEDRAVREDAMLWRLFKARLLPLIHPFIVKADEPMPVFIREGGCYVAARLPEGTGIFEISHLQPRLWFAPEDSNRFIYGEILALHCIRAVFPGYKDGGCGVFRTVRSKEYPEILQAQEKEDFLEALRQREHLPVVRLDVSKGMPHALRRYLIKALEADESAVFEMQPPFHVGMGDALWTKLDSRPALFFSPFLSHKAPQSHKGLMNRALREDVLMCFPYEAMDGFLSLLNEAACAEEVTDIAISVYRLAQASNVAKALCRAAENGKHVLVLMETRARFDESNNYSWAELLRRSGCKVIVGPKGMKCHAKICQIRLCTEGKHRYITQIGTGNYNEVTARQYADIGLITADPVIGRDGAAFFRYMSGDESAAKCEKLLISPLNMKAKLLEYIDQEAEKGQAGCILIKGNALTERTLIEHLQAAAKAGAQIDLIIRGACCLRPGIPELTENIRVRSIVGRFLEHSRLYCFGQGDCQKLYLSSADGMGRNLNRRVEIACPVENAELRHELTHMLRIMLSDNVNAWEMSKDGEYDRVNGEGKRVDSQMYFMLQGIAKDKTSNLP